MQYGVAVAWVDNYMVYPVSSSSSVVSEDTTDLTHTPSTGTIKIPSSTTAAGYPVTAVAPTGFRYCDFTEIRLPETITKIGREAFYSCQNLTKFVIPHSVTEIEPSTFMDCRKLEYVYYSKNLSGDDSYYDNGSANGYDLIDRSWVDTGVASGITTIGDHAFTSCVSLKTFSFPKGIKKIGDSAFQNCRTFNMIRLPTKTAHSAIDIEIGQYAFCDCSSMTLFYFDTNVKKMGLYVFAKCEQLILYYSGKTKPSGATWELDGKWRKKHVANHASEDLDTHYVPLVKGVSQPSEDPSYPGLIFIILPPVEANYIKLDGYSDSKKRPTIFPLGGESLDDGYAKILRFVTPTETHADYYNVSTGKLIIPDKLTLDSTEYPVRVIDFQAFALNTDLKEVVFNESLMQICNHAFYGCSNLTKLDFVTESCGVREISYKVFQDESIEANTTLDTLIIPEDLKYIGAQAFYGFKGVTTFEIRQKTKTVNNVVQADPQLALIGQQAFAYLGATACENGGGTADIVLPNSLSDPWSKANKPKRLDGKNDNDNSVMREAFLEARVLRTVSMSWYTNNVGADQRIGFGSSVFKNCVSLIRFTSNNRLGLAGYSAFAGCKSLKELFLSTKGSNQGTWTKTPWGVKDGTADYGGSWFDVNTSPDLVIYINEDIETGYKTENNNNGLRTGAVPGGKGGLWNSNPHINNYGQITNFTIGTTYPTYYKVEWNTNNTFNNDKVKYKTLDTVDGVYKEYNSATILDDGANPPGFTRDVVSYLTSNNTITGSYCTSARGVIDLSGPFSGGGFNTIGPCAFAYADSDATTPGTEKIILPPGVTTIRSDAFYRDDDRRLNIVTYKNNGAEVVPTGDYASYASNHNYCLLPSTVTRIEQFAFFNHSFEYIDIAGNLALLGDSAFGSKLQTVSSIDAFVLANGQTNIALVSKCLYYKGSDQRTLLYSYDHTSTGSLNLTGADVTEGENNTIRPISTDDSLLKAIAPHALVNSKYSKVYFPSSLVTVYGAAFYKNTSLTEVNIPSGCNLTYISSNLKNPDGSSNFNLTAFDVVDLARPFKSGSTSDNEASAFNSYRSGAGAFGECTALTTFNFNNISSSALKKVGVASFINCKKLVNMTGGTTYKYYHVDSEVLNNEDSYLVSEETVSKSAGVLDLSRFTSLASLGTSAFSGCEKIDYVHIPGNSSLYIGLDPDEAYFSQRFSSNFRDYGTKSTVFHANTKMLFGQKALIVCPNGSDYDEDRYNSSSILQENSYYFAEYDEDVLDATTKYWCPWPKTNPDGYLLMESKEEAWAILDSMTP